MHQCHLLSDDGMTPIFNELNGMENSGLMLLLLLQLHQSSDSGGGGGG